VVVKKNAKTLKVKEQVIIDLVSGLTIQFEGMPDRTTRMRIAGENLPFGNRELILNAEGEEAGAGTYLSGL